MIRARLFLFLAMVASLATSGATDPLILRVGTVTYTVDPTTLRIDARTDGAAPLAVMPPLHDSETVTVVPDGAGWRWIDAEGRVITLSTESNALHLTISGAAGSSLAWSMPDAAAGTWL